MKEMSIREHLTPVVDRSNEQGFEFMNVATRIEDAGGRYKKNR